MVARFPSYFVLLPEEQLPHRLKPKVKSETSPEVN
jgi:hypothetical protein